MKMLVQVDNFDPCSDYYVDAYLNDPDVQRALHANVTRLDHPWSACRYCTLARPYIQPLHPFFIFFKKNSARISPYGSPISNGSSMC